ncbi:hypothetical protein QYF36_019224 [Acer negundo]|nr:hypothetical protein QYF36_019224 [Acer negundo]
MGSSLVTDKNDNILPLTNNVCQTSYSAANSTYCGYTLETVTRAVVSTMEIRVTGNIGDKRAFGGFDSTSTENQHNSQRRTVANHGILVLQNTFANNVELLFVDKTINVGRGPYVYRISGKNHHLMGSLLLATREKPKFAQLYIYDTENEVMNRSQALFGDNTLSSRLEFDIVSELVKMFDECNDLAKVFRMARDHFRTSDLSLSV